MALNDSGNNQKDNSAKKVSKTPNEYFLSNNYENYIVEYAGDISSKFNKIDYGDILIEDKFFANVFIEPGNLNNLIENVKEIVNIEKNFPYNLSELETVNDLYSKKAIQKGDVAYNGQGVIVGIISTGIDYLNPRFIWPEGNSRIVGIWDQTIESGAVPEGLEYGTEYSNKEINEAIKSSTIGRNPYLIVPHKDNSGYGTSLASIVGGRKLSPTDPLVSVAPNCEFAIVKLKPAREADLKINAIEVVTENIYGGTDVGTALTYLSNLQKKLNKPMVVYVPLGSNLGGHDGGTIIERYIDYLSERRGFVVVTNSGDQGDGDTHISGKLEQNGDRKTIVLNVDENQVALQVSIYTIRPDRISIGLTAPTGEDIENIPVPTVNGENIPIRLGSNNIIVQYFKEEKGVGDQRIDIIILNIQGGVWQINLNADFTLNGRYDGWLPQRNVLKEGTRFLNSDPLITLMTPGTSNSIITTAYFNQVNNIIEPSSGNGFTRDGRVKPSVAISGTDVLTVGLDNKYIVTRGAAIAGAILGGTVALLLQWGIVDKNDINLYPQKINNYIISGTTKNPAHRYPNEQWGFGVLNIEQIFKNLGGLSKRINTNKTENETNLEENIGRLYVKIPRDIFSYQRK